MKYVISSYHDSTDQESGIKVLIVKLLKVNALMGGTFISSTEEVFIYRLDSTFAKEILNNSIDDPFEINMDNFVEGDIEVDGEISVVNNHRDYLRAKKEHDNRSLSYDEFKQLAQKSNDKIHFNYFKHLYENFHEDESDEEFNRFKSLLIGKGRVQKELINHVERILLDINHLLDINYLLQNNDGIEDYRAIIENGFKTTDFGNAKTDILEDGNIFNYYLTNKLNITQSSKTILLFGIVNGNNGDNHFILQSTSSFWNLLLFISAKLADDCRFLIKDKCFEIRMSTMLIVFNIVDENKFQVSIFAI